MKKGQITIFITVGIIIFLAFTLLFFVRSVGLRNALFGEQVDPNIKPIKTYVESCLETVGVPGIRLLGLQGGHIYVNNGVIDTGFGQVSYNYFNGRSFLPPLENMKLELNNYIEKNLHKCIEDFETLKNLGEITSGEIKAVSVIKEDRVVLNIRYPIRLKKNDGTYTISDFSYTMFARLGMIHLVVNNIVSRDPNEVDMNTLSQEAVDITVFPNDDSLIYLIEDEHVDKKGKITKFDYMFAVS